ncbi:MAG: DUF4832 domain-containing protein [Bacteroidota bacterium]
MKKQILFLLCFIFSLTLFSQSSTVNYLSSSADFVNPERGFYRYSETRASDYTFLDVGTLSFYRSLHQPNSDPDFQVYSSLIFRYFFLDDFKMSPISQTFLNNMETDFARARQAGSKIIVRMAYTNEVNDTGCGSFICPPYGDAPKNWVLEHIEQLKPIFNDNTDVIAMVQMGFIGVFGEGYYTDYFGDASQSPFKLLDNNWNDRNEVLGALLDAVPKDRMIQLRYPQLKQRYIYGINAPTTAAAMLPSEAFDESDKARLGFHNDCFLASDTDFGTYENYGNSSTSSGSDTTNLKPYKASDSQYTVVGGETCNTDRNYEPFDDCAPNGRADTELARFHYSYLNAEYNYEDVNVDWIGNCMENIKRRLGYRLVLQSGSFSNEVRPGQRINVQLSIKNEGYSSPFNSRTAELVLRNTNTQAVYFAPLDSDPRLWFNTVNINQDICMPNDLPLGNYELLLHLADQQATLYDRSEYAIRLANRLPNSSDVWENNTGYNKLGHTLVVNNSANRPNCGNATIASSCTNLLKVSRIEQPDYAAAATIESTARIESGTNVSLEAGELIVLATPFHAKSGSTFSARIQSCGIQNSANRSADLVADIAELGEGLSLQIFPNPSSANSLLRYELPETTWVNIQLLDVNGQILNTLLKAEQAKGQHELLISQMVRMEAGIYYINVQTAQESVTEKYVLLE